MLTRREFVAIARAVQIGRGPHGRDDEIMDRVARALADNLAIVCAESNNRFGRDQFLRACGLEG